MRVSIQNKIRLISHFRQLRILRRRRSPMNVPTESNESRVFATSSPVLEEHLPPADHWNVVEETRSLDLQEKVEFQELDDYVEVNEVIHK